MRVRTCLTEWIANTAILGRVGIHIAAMVCLVPGDDAFPGQMLDASELADRIYALHPPSTE